MYSDKIIGSIVAGAAGDALGYPVEFMNYDEIVQAYGEKGITDFSLEWSDRKYGEAQISDDTQMTLYTIEGILDAPDDDVETLIESITKSYVTWMCLQQGLQPRLSDGPVLCFYKDVNHRRAPGMTCLSALYDIYMGREVLNDSKGCGGIMRVAPVGLYGASHGWPLRMTSEVASQVALITHKHPLSTLSSAVCAMVIHQCTIANRPIGRRELHDAVIKSFEIIRCEHSYPERYVKVLEDLCMKALSLADDPRSDQAIIEEELGEGWVAEETLAISLFSVARHIDNVKEACISAVNHSGDSDSTGAVAGNIIGAIVGYHAIPDSMKDKLQLHDLIVEFAIRLSR